MTKGHLSLTLREALRNRIDVDIFLPSSLSVVAGRVLSRFVKTLLQIP